MSFKGWTQVEIISYIFQDENGKKEILELVQKRLESEKNTA